MEQNYKQNSKEVVLLLTTDCITKVKRMEYLDINKIEPTEYYCRCQVITNLGRTIDVDYWNEYGIFLDDNDNEIGWKDNGENPELVVKWRKIE